MKNIPKLLLASAVLGLALSQAQAQTPVLVGGWDFNSLSPAGLQSVVSNYSDDYFTLARVDGAGAANLRGTFLANGTGGSELLPLAAATGVSISASPDLISRQIATRTTGPVSGQFFDNAYTGTTDNAMQVGMSVANASQTFAFQLDTANVDLQSISLFLGRSSASGGNTNIAWSYKVGAAAAVSTGLTTTVLTTAGAYSEYLVDFSAFNLDNLGLVSLIGTAAAPSAGYGLRIDNVGVYGLTSFAAIPEPSTYAVIMGALVMGFVGIRRRMLANAV